MKIRRLPTWTFYLILIGVVFDLAVSLIVYNTANRADNAASSAHFASTQATAVAEAAYNSCLLDNTDRQENLLLWTYIIGLIPNNRASLLFKEGIQAQVQISFRPLACIHPTGLKHATDTSTTTNS